MTYLFNFPNQYSLGQFLQGPPLQTDFMCYNTLFLSYNKLQITQQIKLKSPNIICPGNNCISPLWAMILTRQKSLPTQMGTSPIASLSLHQKDCGASCRNWTYDTQRIPGVLS